jgi:hypothetical protein
VVPNNPNELASMPWFEGDFMLSTNLWPAADASAYRTLLQKSWSKPLPRSERALADLCGVPLGAFRPMWRQRIRHKFIKVRGGLANPRVIRDYEMIIKRRTKQVADGHKGAEIRYGKGPQPAGALVTNFTQRLRRGSPDDDKRS